MLPMFRKELGERKGWATDEEILDYYAVAQCTPGVIAVNTATFVGSKIKGWKGAAAATVGVVSPAIVIISVIALFLQHFAEYPVVIHAFAGIRVAVAALITGTVIGLVKKNVKNLLSVLIFAAALLFTLFTDFSPVWIVLAAAAVGIINAKWGKRA